VIRDEALQQAAEALCSALVDVLRAVVAEVEASRHPDGGGAEQPLTFRQVLPFTGVGRTTFQRLIRAGRVPRHQVAERRWVYVLGEVVAARDAGWPKIE
jgi:predicted DNA-binding transcriptional regulator AlpA